jgi:hypothetical protein
VPDFVASCVLVAVTVIVAAAAGAVNKPPEVIVPPPATDHVTAELKLPVPCTLAVHCEVAPAATVDGLHVAETEEILAVVVCGKVELAWLPQARRAERTRQVRETQMQRFFKVVRLLV